MVFLSVLLLHVAQISPGRRKAFNEDLSVLAQINTTMHNYNWDLIPSGWLDASTIDDNQGLIQATFRSRDVVDFSAINGDDTHALASVAMSFFFFLNYIN